MIQVDLQQSQDAAGDSTEFYLGMLDAESPGRLPGLDVAEALVLAGEADPIIPLANAHLMTRLLPRSRLHIYHDGHLGLITSAEELAPLIARFLRGDAAN